MATGIKWVVPGQASATANSRPKLFRPGRSAPDTPADDGFAPMSEMGKGILAGTDQLQALGGGLAAAGGDALGLDGVRDWGLDVYFRNMEEAQTSAAKVPSYKDVEGLGSGVEYLSHGIGTLVPLFLPSLVSGGAGGLIARRAAQKGVETFLKGQVARGVAKGLTETQARAAAIGRATQIGAALGAGASSSGIQTGAIYGEVFEETGESRPGTAAAFGLLTGALDAFPAFRILDKLGLGDQMVNNVARSLGRDVAEQIVTEGSTEAVQTVLEKAAIATVDESYEVLSPENREEITNAAILGAAGGGVIGGGASLTARVTNPVREPKPLVQDILEVEEAARADAAARGEDMLGQEKAAAAAALRRTQEIAAQEKNLARRVDLELRLREAFESTTRDLEEAAGLTAKEIEETRGRAGEIDALLQTAQQRDALGQQVQALAPDAPDRDALTAQLTALEKKLATVDLDALPSEKRDLEVAIRNLTGELGKRKQAVETRRALTPSYPGGVNFSNKDRFKTTPPTDEPTKTAPGEQIPAVDMPRTETPAVESPLKVQPREGPGSPESNAAFEARERERQAAEATVAAKKENDFVRARRQVQRQGKNVVQPEVPSVVAPRDPVRVDTPEKAETESPYTPPEAPKSPAMADALKKAGAGKEPEPIPTGDPKLDSLFTKLRKARKAEGPPAQIQTEIAKVDQQVTARIRERFDSSEIAAVEKAVTAAQDPDYKASLTKYLGLRKTQAEIDRKANQAATSPTNKLPEPTPEQKDAGTYKKGPVTLHGLAVDIENPKGSTRSGKDADGTAWSQTMTAHYGEIRRSKGADGDKVDVFVGEKPEAAMVYVVDQVDQTTGDFDEHKVLMNYGSQQEAIESYRSNYQKGWKVGPVTAMNLPTFKRWLRSGARKKPVSPVLGTAKLKPAPVKAPAPVKPAPAKPAPTKPVEPEKTPAPTKPVEPEKTPAPAIQADSLREAILRAKNTRDLVAWIAEHSEDGFHRLLAARLAQDLEGVGLVRIRQGDAIPGSPTARGAFRWPSDRVTGAPTSAGVVYIREGDGTREQGNGWSEGTILHEALHAATAFIIQSPRTETQRTAVKRLRALQKDIRQSLEDDYMRGALSPYLQRVFAMRGILTKIEEIPTWGLLDAELQAYLRTKIVSGTKETLWSRFVKNVRALFGIGDQHHSLFTELLQTTELLLPEVKESLDVRKNTRSPGNKILSDEALENEGARKKKLNMTKAARMARAKKMGFDPDTVYYHGTQAPEFEEFSPGYGLYGVGVYLTRSAKVANTFAGDAEGRVLPLLIRGKIAPKEVYTDAYRKALNKGFPGGGQRADAEAQKALVAQGYAGAPVGAGDAVVIFDPANIRSINAAFDPDFEGSTSLLADEDVSRPRKVWPAKESINRVIDAQFNFGRRIGDRTVKLSSLTGSMSAALDDQQRVAKLAAQIRSEKGYIERLIVDTEGSVIEGQHRLEALRQLGDTEVPVTVIQDLSDVVAAVAATGVRREHARQVVDAVLEIREAGDTVAEYDTGGLDKQYALAEKMLARAERALDPDFEGSANLLADENIDPGLVYHGTNAEFTKFDAAKEGTGQAFEAQVPGFWFTTDALGARSFGKTVKAAKLSLKNPFRMPAAEYLQRFLYDAEDPKAFRADLEAQGYDGLIIEAEPEYANNQGPSGTAEWGVDNYVAFDAKQIDVVEQNFEPHTDPFSSDPNQVLYEDVIAEDDTPENRLNKSGWAIAKGKVIDRSPESPKAVFSKASAVLTNQTARSDKKVAAAIKKVMTGSMKDKSIRGVLKTIPRAYLPDFAREIPAVKEWVDEAQRMEATKSAMVSQHETTIKDLEQLNSKHHATLKALAELENEATLFGVDPTRPFEKGGDANYRTNYARIKKQWDALGRMDGGKQAQEMFVKMRDSHTQMFEAMGAALEQRLQQLEAEQALENERAKEENRTPKTITGVDTTKIRQLLESQKLPDPYFPLYRFGDFWVSAVKGAGNNAERIFSRFETQADARAFMAELEKIDPEYQVTSGEVNKDGFGSGVEQLDPRFFKAVQGAVANIQDPDEQAQVRDAIHQLFLVSLPEASIRKRMIHRKKREGYSSDIVKGFAGSMFHGANQIAKLQHLTKMQQAMGRMDQQIQDAGGLKANAWLPAVAMEIRNSRHPWAMNPQMAAWAVGLNRLGFTWYLGATPAAALVNMTQTVMLGAPVIAARKGVGLSRTLAALGRTSKEHLTMSRKNMGKRVQEKTIWLQHKYTYEEYFNEQIKQAKNLKERRRLEDDLKAYQQLHAEGAFDKTMTHDVMGIAEAGERYSSSAYELSEKIGAMFHAAEVWNREVTGMAAFRLAREDGMSMEAAVEEAKRTVLHAHFDYCVDTDTEILTTDGWKRYDELTVGDTALAVDDNGAAVESRVNEVNVFPGEKQVIEYSAAPRRFSMVVTPHHDCLVQNYSSRDRKWQALRKVQAQNLKQCQNLLRVPLTELQRTKETYGTDLAALLGWIAAEGQYGKFRGCTEKHDVRLAQSTHHNPQYVKEIEDLLARLGGHCRRFETRKGEIIVWTINGELRKRILKEMPEKLLTMEMFSRMTAAEMRATLDAFSKGDGSLRESGGWTIGQKPGRNTQNLDVLQAMATALGVTATLSRDDPTRSVLITFGTGVTQTKRTSVGRLARQERTVDTVWCPTTEHGTWVARRNGAVFVTGNSNAGRPSLLHNDIGKVAFLFRQHSMNMTYRLIRDSIDTLRSFKTAYKDNESYLEARRRMTGVLGMTAIFGGMTGLPMYWAFEGLANMLLGDDDDPFDFTDEFRASMVQDYGWSEALVTAVMKGPVSAFSGADIASRVTLNGLWFREPLTDEDMEGKFYHYAHEVAGANLAMFASFFKGVSQLQAGHDRGWEYFMPKSVKDVAKTLRYLDEGLTNFRGDPLIPTDAFGGDDLFYQIIGLTPTIVSTRYEQNRAVKNAEQHILNRRSALLSRLWLALQEKDRGEVQDVKNSIREYNRANPHYPLDGETLNRSMTERKRVSQESLAGVNVNRNLRYLARQLRFTDDQSE